MPYQVLIVDDQIMSRQLFENFVSSSENYRVAASIETAKVADAYCAGCRIDLAIHNRCSHERRFQWTGRCGTD